MPVGFTWVSDGAEVMLDADGALNRPGRITGEQPRTHPPRLPERPDVHEVVVRSFV